MNITRKELVRWRQLLDSAIRLQFRFPPTAHPAITYMYCGGCDQDMLRNDIYDLKKHPAHCEMRRMRAWAMRVTKREGTAIRKRFKS